MKFVMDERVKHRLTGLVVIISIAAIFIPAVMKRSNQHLEENVSFSVRLPPKPILPDVAVAGEKEVFKSVKVAQVTVPTIIESPRVIPIAKAEPISVKPAESAVVTASKAPIVSKVVSVIVPPAVKAVVAPKKLAKAAVVGLKKEMYAVQLASFTQRSNAESLVTRLRSKGFKATYNKSRGKQGEYYKVIVGQLNQMHEAKTLQKQLLTSTQLNGFIVKTGVS